MSPRGKKRLELSQLDQHCRSHVISDYQFVVIRASVTGGESLTSGWQRRCSYVVQVCLSFSRFLNNEPSFDLSAFIGIL